MLALIATGILFLSCHSLKTYRTPEWNKESANCHVNLCSGPGNYPANPGMFFYAEFDIPPLPTEFSGAQTYYIYYNIFFGDPYGKFNQFVPQLMLGSALCGSTNAPNYQPIFKNLKQWYISSQYFFALFNTSNSQGWSSYAAAGDLIDVYDGDIVYTSFQLDNNGIWTLTMGIKGNHTAVSTVKATQPYMGLLSNVTSSWKEDIYNKTNVGCCWELYSIENKNEYPPYMNYEIDTTSQNNGIEWKPWRMSEIPDCSYSPNYTLNSGTTSNGTGQIAFFDIFYA